MASYVESKYDQYTGAQFSFWPGVGQEGSVTDLGAGNKKKGVSYG